MPPYSATVATTRPWTPRPHATSARLATTATTQPTSHLSTTPRFVPRGTTAQRGPDMTMSFLVPLEPSTMKQVKPWCFC